RQPPRPQRRRRGGLEGRAGQRHRHELHGLPRVPRRQQGHRRRGPGARRGAGADGKAGRSRRARPLLDAVRRRHEPFHHRSVRRVRGGLGMSIVTPNEPEFRGRIGRTYQESTPWWPDPPAGLGGPNVVMIVLDDTGFAHFGCYGSELTTPAIDRLAGNGLRYTSFHTTALCSPSRASLLTGRNPHAVGMRGVSNWNTGFPHMRGGISPRAATLAELLRAHGYATYAAGKWHLAPMEECSAAGPHTNWPLQKGFDRFYGFLQGETDQFHPELTSDNGHIDPPARPEDGYHVSEDIVDQATGWIGDLQSIRPDRPFFLYLAFGATHAPHQAPLDYRMRWRGKF